MPTLRSANNLQSEKLIECKNISSLHESAVESIISMLKNQSTKLRNDDGEICDYKISLRFLNEQTIQSIIPHWTDFVDAIRSSNPDNQFWTFDKIQLSPAMMDILRQLMMSRSIHRLEFNNGYSDDETNERAIFNLLIGILEKNT